MTWSNFLNSVLQKSLEELLLLVLSVLWLLVRLLRVVVKRKEKGKLVLKIGRKKFVEVKESSNSEAKHTGKNI